MSESSLDLQFQTNELIIIQTDPGIFFWGGDNVLKSDNMYTRGMYVQKERMHTNLILSYCLSFELFKLWGLLLCC